MCLANFTSSVDCFSLSSVPLSNNLHSWWGPDRIQSTFQPVPKPFRLRGKCPEKPNWSIIKPLYRDKRADPATEDKCVRAPLDTKRPRDTWEWKPQTHTHTHTHTHTGVNKHIWRLPHSHKGRWTQSLWTQTAWPAYWPPPPPTRNPPPERRILDVATRHLGERAAMLGLTLSRYVNVSIADSKTATTMFRSWDSAGGEAAAADAKQASLDTQHRRINQA